MFNSISYFLIIILSFMDLSQEIQNKSLLSWEHL